MNKASVFALPGSYLVILVIVALIIALIAVSVMRGKLRTAKKQSAAGNYIRKGSMHLRVNSDHFLYRTVTRRKIEKPQAK